MRVFKIPLDLDLPIIEMDAPDNDEGFATWCRDQVGGYLEIHNVKGLSRQPHLLWVDEEGKLVRRKPNPRATAIATLGNFDAIVGDAIVTGSKPPRVVEADFDLETFRTWVDGMAGIQHGRILP